MQARSRYSSHAAVLGSKTPRSAALIRTRVHALHSLSAQGITGGSEVPAYDRCYILATDIYVIVFRAVPIKIYYAVLIATPEAVLTLTGSGILTAVYIYVLTV